MLAKLRQFVQESAPGGQGGLPRTGPAPAFAAQLANRIMGTGRRLSDAMRAVSEEGDGPLQEDLAHAFRLIDPQGYPFAQALLHVGRGTGVQAVVDLFTHLVYAENRARVGLVKTLLRASR